MTKMLLVFCVLTCAPEHRMVLSKTYPTLKACQADKVNMLRQVAAATQLRLSAAAPDMPLPPIQGSAICQPTNDKPAETLLG